MSWVVFTLYQLNVAWAQGLKDQHNSLQWFVYNGNFLTLASLRTIHQRQVIPIYVHKNLMI